MLFRFRSIAAGAAAALLTLAISHHEAHACGGGAFYPSSTETATVSGHRVVISLSSAQTVLWDQIAYKGAAKDFAWVMPVPDGARVEAASDAWLEVLDAATETRVSSPSLDCGSGPAVSCGGPSAGGGTKGLPNGRQGDPAVTIVHEGSAGPYDTVTIKSDTPDAISKWLTDNGYNIPAEIQPILNDYAAKGQSFIALRLKPESSVAQMKPVRVVMPGALTTFPMRMLAAGAQEKVAIKLFVITEGRVEIDGFPSAEIDAAKLTWDFATSESNYGALRSEALSAEGGKTWLTTYAQAGALLKYGPGYDLSGGLSPTVADAYFYQGAVNQEIDAACDELDPNLPASSSKVVNPCPADGGACATVGADEIDARTLECKELKDLSVALTGLHLADVWLNRFEAELPREALTSDLVLKPLSGKSVSNELLAPTAKNEPAGCESFVVPPPGSEPSSSMRLPSRRDLSTIAFTLAALGLALARRSRREPPALVPVRAG